MGYAGTQAAFLEPPLGRRCGPRGLLCRLPAGKCSHPGLGLQAASCCSAAPPEHWAKKGASVPVSPGLPPGGDSRVQAARSPRGKGNQPVLVLTNASH